MKKKTERTAADYRSAAAGAGDRAGTVDLSPFQRILEFLSPVQGHYQLRGKGGESGQGKIRTDLERRAGI